MLDVRRLRVLRELALRGTLAEVAHALHQTPSSVSQQLTQLEREVGVELLRKAGRRVQLTPQAEILVAHTAVVLEHLERAEADMLGSLAEATGTVRLAVFQSAALALMPQVLRSLREDHPRLRVTMTQREPETALRETWARDFDLVVAEHYPGHSTPQHLGLDRVDLLGDPIQLAVPAVDSPWSDIETLDQAVVAPWVVEPIGAASRHFAEQTCRVAGFEPDVRFETADLQAHIRLVESGNAVALLPSLMWSGRPPSVRLIDLPGHPSRTIFTSTRQALAASPGVLAARASLTNAAASVAV